MHLMVGLVADDNGAIPPEERRKHQTEDEVGPKGYEGEESSQ